MGYVAPVVERLRGRLVLSCQPVRGGPLDTADIVARYVQVAASCGAAAVRIEGRRDIAAVAALSVLPVIGLIKREGPPEIAAITATQQDFDWLLASAVPIVAFEATRRQSEIEVERAVDLIHGAGKLAMADVSTHEEGLRAWRAGADLVGTTLSGYTPHSVGASGPDLDLVSSLARAGVRVMAEGRFNTPADAAAALNAGAHAVTVGSAVTRPEHTASWFVEALRTAAPRRFLSEAYGSDTRLALDVGGTKISCALVDGRRVVHRRGAATPQPATPDAVVAVIESLMEEVRVIARAAAAAEAAPRLGEPEPAHRAGLSDRSPVAIAMTGVVRDGAVTALNRSTMPDWQGFQLAATLERRLGRQVRVVNDAQAAAWGEYVASGGKRNEGFGFVTISTGVGFGFVLDGKLVTGSRGLAGHLGFARVPVGPEARYLEEIASGRALEAAARLLRLPGPAEVIAAAEVSEVAAAAVKGLVSAVRMALGDAALLMDLSKISVGGSVGLNPVIFQALAAEPLHPLVDVTLIPAVLGADAGLVGAASLAVV